MINNEIYVYRHNFMLNNIRSYAKNLKSSSLNRMDFNKQLCDYISKWREVKISNSNNAIDYRIREAAKVEIPLLDSMIKSLSSATA